MINWNDLDQVGDTLWGEHKEIEDHLVPQPKERDGNSFLEFGRCSRKQRREDDYNAISSTMETCGTKSNFLVCNAKNSCSSNIIQELNDASMDMDTWPDLPNLSLAFGEGFRDGIVRDSVVTGLASDLANSSDLQPVAGFMEGYNHSSGLFHDQDSSSLTKTSILLNGNEMQLDGEPDLFGHDDKENDKFMDYDWASIEDFGDLDKMFRNDDSIFGNEIIDNTDTFLAASAGLISCTSQSIPEPVSFQNSSVYYILPKNILLYACENTRGFFFFGMQDIRISGEQAWEAGSSTHHLVEHSNVKVNPLQKGKADMENQTLGTKKNQGEKGKGGSSQGLNNYLHDKNQQISSPAQQASATNPPPTFQSQPLEQPNLSHHVMLADYGYPAYQYHGMPLPPQICATRNQHEPVSGGFKAHLDFSKHPKRAGTASKPLIMTPKEKIEKLRRRQQMQAMLAIQKQREQYNHQISSADEVPSLACLQNFQNQDVTRNTVAVEEQDASSQAEQDQSQMLSSSLDGRSIEEAIYYQLQGAMEKLDMNVRLSIRDSLYRLARSAMERQNSSDRNSTNMCNKEEDEISADDESNQERYSRMIDSEAVTNPIDRIIAHLLFHNPSRSSAIPVTDAGMSMATSL